MKKIITIVLLFFLLMNNSVFSKTIKLECNIGNDIFKKNILITFDTKKKIVMYGEEKYELFIFDDYYVGTKDKSSQSRAIIFADKNLDKQTKKEMLEREYLARVSLDRYTGKLLWGMVFKKEDIFKNIQNDIEFKCTHKGEKKF
jgi:hypothetical protein